MLVPEKNKNIDNDICDEKRYYYFFSCVMTTFLLCVFKTLVLLIHHHHQPIYKSTAGLGLPQGPQLYS